MFTFHPTSLLTLPCFLALAVAAVVTIIKDGKFLEGKDCVYSSLSHQVSEERGFVK